LLAELRGNPGIEVLSGTQEIEFDGENQLSGSFACND